MLRRYLTGFVLASLTTPALADFEVGVEAYRAGDYDVAVAEWSAEADAGHPVAAWLLGNLYARGKGVVQSHGLAARYLRMAAEAGHPGAQTATGRYYYYGNDEADIERDYVAALGWFEKAALQRDARAQYYLGLMHRNGEGVKPDGAEGLRWLFLSAKKHYAPTFVALAEIYLDGDRVEQDPIEGAMYLEVARATATTAQRPMIDDARDRLLKHLSAEVRDEGTERAELWLAGHPKKE